MKKLRANRENEEGIIEIAGYTFLSDNKIAKYAKRIIEDYLESITPTIDFTPKDVDIVRKRLLEYVEIAIGSYVGRFPNVPTIRIAESLGGNSQDEWVSTRGRDISRHLTNLADRLSNSCEAKKTRKKSK